MEIPDTVFPSEILALTDHLRRFIKEAIPEVEERVYKGGSGMGYHTQESGAFCGLFLRQNAVYLSFPHGDRLPDPEGLLQSQGRHIPFYPGDSIPEDALLHLLIAAILVGAENRY